MTGLGEAKKRDFVSQLIVILLHNSELLIEKGFDPVNRMTGLQTHLTSADAAEGRQTDAKAASRAATTEANKTLMEAYEDGSAIVELLVGLLGKKHPLVLEIKKLRKYGRSKQKPEEN